MMKLGNFFKDFCLVVDHSTTVACLQQVSTRCKLGARGKAMESMRSEVADPVVQSLPSQEAVPFFEGEKARQPWNEVSNEARESL